MGMTVELLNALAKLSMGCFCSREKVVIESKSYEVLDHIAEGYVLVLTATTHNFATFLLPLNEIVEASATST